KPHDGSTITECGLDRAWIQPAHTEVAADRAAYPNAIDCLCDRVGDGVRREVVRLQHDRREAEGRGVARRFEGIDTVPRSDHRLGAKVAVEVDRPVQHDLAHRYLPKSGPGCRRILAKPTAMAETERRSAAACATLIVGGRPHLWGGLTCSWVCTTSMANPRCCSRPTIVCWRCSHRTRSSYTRACC